MAPKHQSRSRQFDSYSSEDRSDTEYRMELESESDSSSDEEISNSKGRRRRSNNKRAKRIGKRVLFRWHEDDEITVLKKLYEFSGKDATYTKAFYEFVRKRLRREVSMHQMSNKIHGLRKEYWENECGVKSSGAHHRRVFELSERIWGVKKKKNNNGGAADAEGLMEYLEGMEIDVKCLMPSCLEYVKKEWDVQMLMYMELLSKKWNFEAKLRELISKTPTTETFHNL